MSSQLTTTIIQIEIRNGRVSELLFINLLMKKNVSIMFFSFSTNIFLNICCNIQNNKITFFVPRNSMCSQKCAKPGNSIGSFMYPEEKN